MTQRSVERASLSYRGRRRPSAALACCRWRKAAALMRFWQAAEQNRQVRLREVSTKTRSQLSALQTRAGRRTRSRDRLLSGNDLGASNASCAPRAEMIAGSQNVCEEPR